MSGVVPGDPDRVGQLPFLQSKAEGGGIAGAGIRNDQREADTS